MRGPVPWGFGGRGRGAVALHARPRLAQVVLAVAEEVLEAELVLDGHHDHAVGPGERPELGEEGLARVLEDADAQDDVEAVGVVEGVDGAAHDLDVGQAVAPGGRGPGPGEGAFEGDHVGPRLGHVAGEGSGAGPDVEHPGAGAEVEGAEEVGPLAGEVVAGGPVGDVAGELVGGGAAVVGRLQDLEDGVLRAVGVVDLATDQSHATAGVHPLGHRRPPYRRHERARIWRAG